MATLPIQETTQIHKVKQTLETMQQHNKVVAVVVATTNNQG
ncbi:MAG: hypothetical protein P0116_01145 [Candidatus Nitrosocosmicus sp.]|nr:hypothetical protein [Candidatus Nitrosocosmicus sp.]